MLTIHIARRVRSKDEFLSYTLSIYFEITHAMFRHERGQREPFIANGDSTKLKRMDDKPLSLCWAADLVKAFSIMRQLEYEIDLSKGQLARLDRKTPKTMVQQFKDK
jgi:predicted glutamine amidotransferase